MAALQAPRIVWLMLPAGEATEAALTTLMPLLSPGDLVVDGANAYYKDDQRRAELLARGRSSLPMPVCPAACGGWKTATASCSAAAMQSAARLKPYMEVLGAHPDHRLAAYRPGRLRATL